MTFFVQKLNLLVKKAHPTISIVPSELLQAYQDVMRLCFAFNITYFEKKNPQVLKKIFFGRLKILIWGTKIDCSSEFFAISGIDLSGQDNVDSWISFIDKKIKIFGKKSQKLAVFAKFLTYFHSFWANLDLPRPPLTGSKKPKNRVFVKKLVEFRLFHRWCSFLTILEP